MEPPGEVQVVIVEDSIDLNRLFTRKLSRAGYNCFSAHGVKDALAYLQNFAPPLLIIVDLELPDGFGGDILQYMSKHPESFANTRRLLVSASAFQSRKIQTEFELDMTLLKPVSPCQLLLVTRQMIPLPAAQACIC